MSYERCRYLRGNPILISCKSGKPQACRAPSQDPHECYPKLIKKKLERSRWGKTLGRNQISPLGDAKWDGSAFELLEGVKRVLRLVGDRRLEPHGSGSSRGTREE